MSTASYARQETVLSIALLANESFLQLLCSVDCIKYVWGDRLIIKHPHYRCIQKSYSSLTKHVLREQCPTSMQADRVALHQSSLLDHLSPSIHLLAMSGSHAPTWIAVHLADEV